VPKRDYFRSLGFWPLQIAGWSGFYLLTVLSLLPLLKQPGLLRSSTAFVLLLFVCSSLLRYVCRALMRRSSWWLDLEVRTFACALPLAAAAAGLQLLIRTAVGRSSSWADWLLIFVQVAITLFFWSNLYYSVKQWQRSALERERLLRAEAEVRDARLSALRYQLNPHFLFNSLNAVSTLVLEGNAAGASRMLARIGDFLRTILQVDPAPETPLHQELAFVGQYLAIEQIRLGGRMRIEQSIAPDTLDGLVPSLLLQPLVENAVRHGLAPLVEGGTISIHSRRRGERLRISVHNTGMPRSAAAEPPAGGIGLSNTAERLKALYGAAQEFSLSWPEAGGCEVVLELPFRKAAA
jgi:two-component system, LytTR family, sensor kinase